MDSKVTSQFVFREFLDRLMNLLNKTKGRERICRFFQYFGKFFKAFINSNKNASESSQEWSGIFEGIGSACAATRKVLRFGMEFPCLLRINDLLEKYFKSLNSKKESGRFILNQGH